MLFLKSKNIDVYFKHFSILFSFKFLLFYFIFSIRIQSTLYRRLYTTLLFKKFRFAIKILKLYSNRCQIINVFNLLYFINLIDNNSCIILEYISSINKIASYKSFFIFKFVVSKFNVDIYLYYVSRFSCLYSKKRQRQNFFSNSLVLIPIF